MQTMNLIAENVNLSNENQSLKNDIKSLLSDRKTLDAKRIAAEVNLAERNRVVTALQAELTTVKADLAAAELELDQIMDVDTEIDESEHVNDTNANEEFLTELALILANNESITPSEIPQLLTDIVTSIKENTAR